MAKNWEVCQALRNAQPSAPFYAWPILRRCGKGYTLILQRKMAPIRPWFDSNTHSKTMVCGLFIAKKSYFRQQPSVHFPGIHRFSKTGWS